MIDDIKLLLGNNITAIPLDEPTIHAAIAVASQHYMRYRSYVTNWATNPRAYSWIMEYALAYCKMIMGEVKNQNLEIAEGDELVATAMTFMANLERELITYP